MSTKHLFLIIFLGSLFSNCAQDIENESTVQGSGEKVSLVVLGNIQDAGYPQIGCMKSCCKNQWQENAKRKMITCLGLIDRNTNNTWMFEASPDMKFQIKELSDRAGNTSIELPKGIFLTHGHIGHYTGLMQLGRESMNANNVPVYAMPRMKDYIETNGPWDQLVSLNNISIQELHKDVTVQLTDKLIVVPFIVPHRGEYTETVGYRIEGPEKKVLFIPDIDKWHKWDRNIKEEIKGVDILLLDATFYKNGEVGDRDMSEIPHPFVEESMRLFADLPKEHRSKIHFIHFNHTNPLIQEDSEARKEVLRKGYKIAEEGLLFEL